MDSGLDDRLLAAHAAGQPSLLAGLYAEAADLAEAAGEPVRSDFYLTHAWVFALEADLPEAKELRARLIARGRECER